MKTKRGEAWSNDVTPLPEDVAGYLRQFAPGADAVVLEYITEALHTFIARNFFATAVMIGAASEATLYLLADSLVRALGDTKKQTELAKRIESRSLNRLMEYIERIVTEGHKRHQGVSIRRKRASSAFIVRSYPAPTK